MQETESASKILLNDKNIDTDNCKRVLKRCRILLTVLKRLWFCFADNDVPNKNVTPGILVLVLNSCFTLLFDVFIVAEAVSNFDNLHLEPTGNPFLDHIINRGKQILQDRSVLYRTPVKNSLGKNLTTNGTQNSLYWIYKRFLN